MMKSQIDYTLFIASFLLIIFGILILTNTSLTSFYFLNHQVIFGLIPGSILAFLIYKIRLDFLKKWAPILLLINLAFLAMVFLPKIGMEYGGAARWINLGKISFQPAEFLKLTFIIYLASWLTSRTEKTGSRRLDKKMVWEFSQTFIAFLIIIAIISGLLISQPDISTLGIIVLVASLMYFFANTPLWQSFLIIAAGTAGLLALIKFASYRMARILVFLNPETDPLGIGYQIKQALIAVGSGGISGLGLGMSAQKFGFLPHSMSDSVFAILSEETGFIGSIILILLFFIFFWQGFKIAKKTRDKFCQFLALGISSWISLQAFINIGSMIGVLPLAGVPLPFISYGGSHLVAELIGVGILLNISKQG